MSAKQLIEHRSNWKDCLGKAAKKKAERRLALLVELDTTREDIQGAGTDFEKYDALKAEQRRIIAELAML